MDNDFFQWIEAHSADDPSRLRLRHGRERAAEILQIESRRRFSSKLRNTLAADPRFVFPTAVSGEQATSEPLAAFHASLVAPGESVVDLTAGLGIDAMALAAGPAARVTAVEIDPDVAAALVHNSRRLDNLEVVNADCRQFVDSAVAEGRRFDVAFIDPARRDDAGGRTYALDQCRPDVVAMLPAIRRICSRLIVKASPMLDITHTLRLLPGTCRVIALGSTTECKELDFIIDFDHSCDRPTITAATVTGDDGHALEFTFTPDQEAAATATYGIPAPGQYILEPYPAVMKAGCPRLLAERFGLRKPAPNTHVWFGDAAPDDFPGRAFRIVDVQPFASRIIKRYAATRPRIGVTARNFDMSADALRARLGVKDGPGRLFAISDSNRNRFLVTTD